MWETKVMKTSNKGPKLSITIQPSPISIRRINRRAAIFLLFSLHYHIFYIFIIIILPYFIRVCNQGQAMLYTLILRLHLGRILLSRSGEIERGNTGQRLDCGLLFLVDLRLFWLFKSGKKSRQNDAVPLPPDLLSIPAWYTVRRSYRTSSILIVVWQGRCLLALIGRLHFQATDWLVVMSLIGFQATDDVDESKDHLMMWHGWPSKWPTRHHISFDSFNLFFIICNVFIRTLFLPFGQSPIDTSFLLPHPLHRVDVSITHCNQIAAIFLFLPTDWPGVNQSTSSSTSSSTWDLHWQTAYPSWL